MLLLAVPVLVVMVLVVRAATGCACTGSVGIGCDGTGGILVVVLLLQGAVGLATTPHHPRWCGRQPGPQSVNTGIRAGAAISDALWGARQTGSTDRRMC